jgi:hypothetical protein
MSINSFSIDSLQNDVKKAIQNILELWLEWSTQ